VFAGELFTQLNMALKAALIACIALIVLLGFWAATE